MTVIRMTRATNSHRRHTRRTHPSQLNVRSRSRSGFSLFEILLVMGLLASLAATCLPGVLRWQRSLPLERSASGLQRILRQSRVQAIREGNAVVTVISAADDSAGSMETLQTGRNSESASGPVTSMDSLSRHSDNGRHHVKVPAELRVHKIAGSRLPRNSRTRYLPDNSGDSESLSGVLAIVFHPDGSCEDCVLRISDRHGQELFLIADRLTGTISITSHAPSLL